MKFKLNIALITGIAFSLAACGDEWGTEAGSYIDEGAFGNPTMNNTLAHTGNLMVDLNARFAEQVPTMVNFAFDSAALDETSKATLREQARWIRQFPEVRFRVYGHTDAVGSPSYNKSLGQRRAQSVVNYLVSQGATRGQLEAVASFGETQPLIATSDRERRNRRTVTEVSGFMGRAPDAIDGKYAAVIRGEYVASGTEAPITGAASTGQTQGE